MYKFGQRSRNRLRGVHPDLVLVLAETLRRSQHDLAVLEGVRTLTRQKELVESGASQTLNSYHIPKLYGTTPLADAVDVGILVGGQIRWDWSLYDEFGETVKGAADDLGIRIVWGGDWKFRDGPHVQRAARI